MGTPVSKNRAAQAAQYRTEAKKMAKQAEAHGKEAKTWTRAAGGAQLIKGAAVTAGSLVANELTLGAGQSVLLGTTTYIGIWDGVQGFEKLRTGEDR